MNCTKCNKANRNEAVYCKWCGEVINVTSKDPLEELTGMDDVKQRLRELVKTCEGIALRAQKTGVKVKLGMDMVLVGSTGAGKTELVTAIQQLLFANDIIKNPKAFIVDAVDYDDFSMKNDKVDSWQTNIKKAKGGILVIENAQKLLPQQSSDDVNKLDKLFKCMNGEWLSDPIVILTGLPGLKAFMNTNPDIANRFEVNFNLKDFSVDELVDMCERKRNTKYELEIETREREK